MTADSESDEKRTPDVTDIATDTSEGPRDFPWAWKLIALVCGIALSWGSSFSENTLGPLKSTLIKQLDITNAQVRTRLRAVLARWATYIAPSSTVRFLRPPPW